MSGLIGLSRGVGRAVWSEWVKPCESSKLGRARRTEVLKDIRKLKQAVRFTGIDKGSIKTHLKGHSHIFGDVRNLVVCGGYEVLRDRIQSFEI